MADTAIPLYSLDSVFDALNRVFSDRHHSVAAYVLTAGAHEVAGDGNLAAAIGRIAEWDRTQAEALAEVIESLGGIPQVVPLPHTLVEQNYLSLQYLGGVVAGHLAAQRKDCSEAVALAKAACCAPAYRLLKEIEETLARQIAEIRGMTQAGGCMK